MTSPTRYGWWLGLLALNASLLLGCGGKEVPQPDNGPRADAPKEKDKPKGGDLNNITAEDLRKAAEAAGGKIDTTPPKPKEPESLIKAKPDLTFTVEDVEAKHSSLAAWYADLYKNHFGKVIELRGVVESAAYGNISLVSKKIRPFPCDSEDREPYKKVFPGQTVVLRAKISDVFPLQIIESKGPTPPEYTADQFASEMAGARAEVEKKFKDKYLIVTGVIEKVDTDKIGHAHVKLKTENASASVVCHFLGGDYVGKMRNTTLKPGMKLKAIGQWWADSDRSLNRCEVLELTP